MAITVGTSFHEALGTIEKHFRQPPLLDFGNASCSDLAYGFPTILPSRRGGTTPLASQLSLFLETATKKFYYEDFRKQLATNGLSWPDEKLGRRAKRYVVQQKRIAPRGVVNATREAALEWFRSDLVDEIERGRQSTCTFFLGMPGSGKSTLLKYLVNTERAYSKSHRVVFSRFESTKFFRFCGERMRAEGIDTDEPWPASKLLILFQDYYWFIVLRDLVLHYTYDLTSAGTLARKSSCPYFGNVRAIDDFVTRAEEDADAGLEAQTRAFYVLSEAITPQQFDHKNIFEIDFRLRRAMVRMLSADLKICVIFDGLDALSPEDQVLDNQKFKVLEFILIMYGYGSKGTEGAFDPGFSHHAMIALRPNTHERLTDAVDKEVWTSTRIRVYRIAPLSPAVVLFRSIRRGLAAVGTPDEEVDAIADQLYRSVGMLLATIGGTLELGSSADRILSLFNGNLRDCFEFMVRVLSWIRDESETKLLPPRSTVADLVSFISSDESEHLLRQKGYRLIELLLFYQTSSFQNAILVQKIDALMSTSTRTIFGKAVLRKNYSCTGLIDNVFNYHSFDDAKNNDAHSLLQKIRILQVCIREGTSTDAHLCSKLAELGYDVSAHSELERSILILRYVGFLDRFDENGTKYYSITPKGRVVVEHLIYQSSYLEHIYHKTLLPAGLVSQKQDMPRSESHERWTLASIRNYFILLAYIRFVESNPARGKSVPAEFRIWPAMVESVFSAILRILSQDHAAKQDKSPSIWFASIALQDIEELIARWRSDTLLPGS